MPQYGIDIHLLPLPAIVYSDQFVILDSNEIFEELKSAHGNFNFSHLGQWSINEYSQWNKFLKSVKNDVESIDIEFENNGFCYTSQFSVNQISADGQSLFLGILTQPSICKSTSKSSSNELLGLKDALFKVGIVSIADRTGKIIEANEKFCEISQYTLGELLGQDHRLINSGTHESGFFKNLWRTISSGQVWRGDICNKAKDGSLYWVDTVITPLLDTSGKIEKYLSIRYVITDKIAANQQLVQEKKIVEQHKQNLINILSNNQHAYVLFDQNRRILAINSLANQYAQMLYGRDVHEGMSMDEIVTEEQLEILLNAMKPALLGEHVNFEMVIEDIKHASHTLTIYVNPAYDAEGAISGVLFGVRDISDELNASNRIKELYTSLQKVYNNTPAMLFSLNSKMQITHVSEFWLNYLGYNSGEVIGKLALEFMDGYSSLKVSKENTLLRLFNEGNVADFPVRWRNKAGKYLDMQLSAVVDRDHNGKVEKVLAVMIDVTPLKSMQMKLTKNELSLLEAQQIGKLMAFNADLISGQWEGSRNADELLGWNLEKRSIWAFLKCVPIEQRFKLVESVRTAIGSGSKLNSTFEFVRPNNKTAIVINVIATIRQRKNVKGLRIVGTLQDITEMHSSQLEVIEVHNRLKFATHTAKIGIWEYSFKHETINVNEVIEEIFGMRVNVRKHLISEELDQLDLLVHPDDLQVYSIFKDDILVNKRDSSFVTFRIIRYGQIRYIQSQFQMVYASDHSPKSVIGVTIDITHQKEHEQ